MKKELEQIQSRIFISLLDKVNIPNGKLEEVATRQLVRGLAEVIINEMDTLPVTYIKEVEINTGGDIYKIRINIISDEELKRLHKIEEEMKEIKLALCNQYDDHICIGELPY